MKFQIVYAFLSFVIVSSFWIDNGGSAYSGLADGPRINITDQENISDSPKSQYDRVVFQTSILGETITEGFYTVSGRPISVTYDEAPNLQVALTLGNLGPRPIRIVWPDGKSWLNYVKFELRREGSDPAKHDPHASWEGFFKRMTTLVAHTIRVKERRIIKTQYFRRGVAITPSEYEFDPNYGYRPKQDLYDDYKTVQETIEGFPSMLEQQSYAEAISELVDDSGQRLPPGVYWVVATIDWGSFELNLPPSHVKTSMRFSGPWEIRKIVTPEDRANYHRIRAQYFLREKNLVAAEQELMIATSVNPNSTTTWWYLADFYETNKYYDKAIAAYQRVKELSEKKGLKPPADPERPELKEVNGKLLFGEPVYIPGTIERVQRKKLERGL